MLDFFLGASYSVLALKKHFTVRQHSVIRAIFLSERQQACELPSVF
jgi:hypothetical protein|nr:MAG TPA: hypothetical protein [Caudoviricetes sp.]